MNCLKKLQITRYSGKLALAALVLLYAVGCNSSAPVLSSVEAPSPYSVHVAFSGGGWRAHTAHAGWTMSLLNNGSNKLEDVFANVGTVSSNSGGSWFSTMLMYSGSFVAAIEAKDAINTWHKAGEGATGWLGQQQYLFDQAYCHWLKGDLFLACVFRKYAGSLKDATNWNDVVKKLVFKDYQITVPLSGKRQTWAEHKPLLLAATMLTTEAVLGASGVTDDKQYYQACLSPSKPVLNGDSGAKCNPRDGTDVTPVTFSSMPRGSTFTAPPFLPAAGAGKLFNLGYTENASSSPATALSTINNPLTNDNVPVMTAAAASSAAAGFEASGVVSEDWELAYKASDEALNFKLKENKVLHVVANGMSVKDLAAKKIVQIADGGPVDNSGVAQLVSFLQLNNQADGFNIVAFDNVQELYTPNSTAAANVGIDIAYLFGKGLWHGNKFCSGANGSGTCVTVPNLQIFEVDPLSRPELTWSAAASDNSPPKLVHELIYTKYKVTTVDNPTFGVAAGTTGTLHAFTCAWFDADTSPQNKSQDGDFKAYAHMLSFINVGLQLKKKEGLGYLQKALGLNQ